MLTTWGLLIKDCRRYGKLIEVILPSKCSNADSHVLQLQIVEVFQEIILEACLFYAVIVTSMPCKYLLENLKGIFEHGQTADLDLDMIGPLLWEDELEGAGISGKDINHLGVEANGCIH